MHMLNCRHQILAHSKVRGSAVSPGVNRAGGSHQRGDCGHMPAHHHGRCHGAHAGDWPHGGALCHDQHCRRNEYAARRCRQVSSYTKMSSIYGYTPLSTYRILSMTRWKEDDAFTSPKGMRNHSKSCGRVTILHGRWCHLEWVIIARFPGTRHLIMT